MTIAPAGKSIGAPRPARTSGSTIRLSPRKKSASRRSRPPRNIWHSWLFGQAGYVVRHHDQIVRASVPIDDVITQQRFGPEPQSLESAKGALLLGSHAGHDLPQSQLSRDREQFVCKQAPQPNASVVGAEEQHDF